MRPRRDWSRIDADMRGAWLACAGAPADAGVRELAGLVGDRPLAARVYFLRAFADAALITWWREGRLSFSQLWACVGYAPGDGVAQQREAAGTSAAVRRVYQVANDP